MEEQLKTSYHSLKVCVTGNDHHSSVEPQTPGDPLRDTRQAPQEDSADTPSEIHPLVVARNGHQAEKKATGLISNVPS